MGAAVGAGAKGQGPGASLQDPLFPPVMLPPGPVASPPLEAASLYHTDLSSHRGHGEGFPDLMGAGRGSCSLWPPTNP